MKSENEINEIMSWLEVIAQSTKEPNPNPVDQHINHSLQILIKEIHLSIMRHNFRINNIETAFVWKQPLNTGTDFQ